jgi:hypothetical protein
LSAHPTSPGSNHHRHSLQQHSPIISSASNRLAGVLEAYLQLHIAGVCSAYSDPQVQCDAMTPWRRLWDRGWQTSHHHNNMLWRWCALKHAPSPRPITFSGMQRMVSAADNPHSAHRTRRNTPCAPHAHMRKCTHSAPGSHPGQTIAAAWKPR